MQLQFSEATKPYYAEFAYKGADQAEVGSLNTVLTVKYANLQPTTDGTSEKTKYYLAQAEFFF